MKSVNSSGGRILVLVFLVIVGLCSERLGIPYAKEIVLTTLATLLAVLAGQHRQNG
jgi:FtsH-binding integral membrane protein